MKKLIAICLSGMILCSCSFITEKEKIEDTQTAEQLYKKGYKQLQKTSYIPAAESFEKIELEHPYSKWAIKSKLMSAYSYYKAEKYDDAIIALERFIKFHPSNLNRNLEKP